jgi:hypothetical protein
MRIVVWKDGPPPEGFSLGVPPTDFGCPRAAYRWRDPKPGETSSFTHGKILDAYINRGDRLLVRADGSFLKLDWQALKAGELLDLLREAARDGVEGDL